MGIQGETTNNILNILYIWDILGAFHYAKISWNFGPNVNGTVRARWKFSGQSGPPPEVVLFDRSFRSDRELPFHFQKFFFPVPLQLVTTVKIADGSDESVYEWSVCKLQTQDVNFLLMHSWTQAQVQQSILICFFFWFSPVFKDKYITVDYWLLSECWRCFPVFFS